MTHGFLPEGSACCCPLIAGLRTVAGDCANLGWACRCLGKAFGPAKMENGAHYVVRGSGCLWWFLPFTNEIMSL